MPREVSGSSLGGRILVLLAERHPITLRQLAVALHVRDDAIALEARRLQAQGLVVLEPLGEEVYAALSGQSAYVSGLPPRERERIRARKGVAPPPRDPSDPAFL